MHKVCSQMLCHFGKNPIGVFIAAPKGAESRPNRRVAAPGPPKDRTACALGARRPPPAALAYDKRFFLLALVYSSQTVWYRCRPRMEGTQPFTCGLIR